MKYRLGKLGLAEVYEFCYFLSTTKIVGNHNQRFEQKYLSSQLFPEIFFS